MLVEAAQDSELETGAGPRSGRAGEAGLDNEMLVSCRVLTTDGAVAGCQPSAGADPS